MQKTKEKNRYFSEATRAAALEVRRANAALPKGNGIEVFAVRPGDDGTTFAWEIRRFGGIVVKRGSAIYKTASEALEAGRQILTSANRSPHDRREGSPNRLITSQGEVDT